MMKSWKSIAFLASVALLAACKTTGSNTAPATASDAGTTAGSTDTGGGTTGDTGTSGGAGTSTDTGSGSIPALINVNLQNVLNDLSVSLQVNRNSIPVTAQVPIDVAATVCGVSVDALAASVASGKASCTATTTRAQLTHIDQHHNTTCGNVEGGDQTTTPPGG